MQSLSVEDDFVSSREERQKQSIFAAQCLLNSIKYFNEECESNDFPIEAECTDWIRQIADSSKKDAATRELRTMFHANVQIDPMSGEPIGWFRHSHMRTIVGGVVTYLNNKGNSDDERFCGILIGSMQLGKTMVFCGLFLLLPVIVWAMSKGKRKIMPILNMPGKWELENQTKLEMEAIRSLYAKFVTFKNVNTGKTITIEDYFKTFIQDKSSDQFANVQNFWNSHLVKRTRYNISKYRNRMNEFQKQGYEILSFTDESHFGTDQGGVLDRKELDGELDGDFIDEGVDKICISATPSEQTASGTAENWIPIYVWVDKTYVGPPYWNGVDLPCTNGFVERLPVYCEMNNYLRSKGFTATEMGLLDSHIAFQSYKDFLDVFGSGTSAEWQRFRQDFAVLICKIIDKLGKRGQQIFFRVFSKNEAANDLAEMIEARYQIIRFYGKHPEGKCIKQLCAPHKDKLVVILATARSRMGDAFPSSCTVFIDFTKAGSTANSIMQGTFGRACGHNKNSLVLLRIDLFTFLEKFIKNKCRIKNERGLGLGRQQCSRTKLSSKAGRAWVNYDLYFDRLLKHNGPRCSWLNLLIKDCNDWMNKNRIIRASGKEKAADREFEKSILTRQRIHDLPQYLPLEERHLRFLNWGEQDRAEAKGYYMVLRYQEDKYKGKGQGQGGVVGRRYHNPNHDIKFRPRRVLNDRNKRVEVQVVYCVVDKATKLFLPKLDRSSSGTEFKVLGLSLRLADTYKPLDEKDTEVRSNSMRAPRMKQLNSSGPGKKLCSNCFNYCGNRTKTCNCGYTF